MPLNTATLTVNALRTAPDALVVTLGSQTTYGVLNDEKQIVNDGTDDVPVHSRELHVAAGSLTGVVDGTTITLRRVAPVNSASVSYTVRNRPMPRENGDLWAIRLAKVET